MSAFGPDPGPPFLYPIIDTDVCRARDLDPAATAEACFGGGARVLQLRAKRESGAALLSLAESIVLAARRHDALVVINDRADVARLCGAGGVHVGQEDLGVDDVRRIAGDGTIVGLSTHDERQVDAALQGHATYIAVGPVFGTATKDTGYTARGLDLVRYAAGRGKPVVAIGGITLERVESAIDAGASGVAVISDLLTSGDPESRTRAFLARLALLRRPV
jgi:thiamine-phosphate pyrophosphorylase